MGEHEPKVTDAADEERNPSQEPTATPGPTPEHALPSHQAPEPPAARSHGPRSLKETDRRGVHVTCTTTFAARRAALSELLAPTPPPGARSARDILGGPLPARGARRPRAARTSVLVVTPGRLVLRDPARPARLLVVDEQGHRHEVGPSEETPES